MKVISQCMFCGHLVRPETGHGLHCTAFPEGMPDDIYFNRHLHDRPYAGDGGVQWQADSEDAAQQWEMLLRRFEESHPGWRRQREDREAEEEQ